MLQLKMKKNAPKKDSWLQFWRTTQILWNIYNLIFLIEKSSEIGHKMACNIKRLINVIFLNLFFLLLATRGEKLDKDKLTQE